MQKKISSIFYNYNLLWKFFDKWGHSTFTQLFKGKDQTFDTTLTGMKMKMIFCAKQKAVHDKNVFDFYYQLYSSELEISN